MCTKRRGIPGFREDARSCTGSPAARGGSGARPGAGPGSRGSAAAAAAGAGRAHALAQAARGHHPALGELVPAQVGCGERGIIPRYRENSGRAARESPASPAPSQSAIPLCSGGLWSFGNSEGPATPLLHTPTPPQGAIPLCSGGLRSFGPAGFSLHKITGKRVIWMGTIPLFRGAPFSPRSSSSWAHTVRTQISLLMT